MSQSIFSFPARCLTCGGKTYLDDDNDPKCFMCGGDPRVKRVPGVTPRSSGMLPNPRYGATRRQYKKIEDL